MIKKLTVFGLCLFVVGTAWARDPVSRNPAARVIPGGDPGGTVDPPMSVLRSQDYYDAVIDDTDPSGDNPDVPSFIFDHERCELWVTYTDDPVVYADTDTFSFGTGEEDGSTFRNTMTEIGVSDYSNPYFLNDFHESINVDEEGLVTFVNSYGWSFSGGQILNYAFDDHGIDFSVSFMRFNTLVLRIDGTLHSLPEELEGSFSLPAVALTMKMSGLAVDRGLYPDAPTRSFLVKNDGTLEGRNDILPCQSQQICECDSGPQGAWCRSRDCDNERTCRGGGWGGGGTCLWHSQNGSLLSGLVLLPLLFIRRKR